MQIVDSKKINCPLSVCYQLCCIVWLYSGLAKLDGFVDNKKNMTNLKQPYLNSIDAMQAGAKRMQKLAKPLYKHFGLNGCFCYLIFDTGETLYLPSDYEEVNVFNKFIAKNSRWSIIDSLSQCQQHGFVLEDIEPKIWQQLDPSHIEIQQEYNHHHSLCSLELIETTRGRALRLIYYLAPKERDDINAFYLNNLELFKRISRQLTRDLEKEINQLPLFSPTTKERRAARDNFIRLQMVHSKAARSYVKDTALHYPKYNELENINISQREKDIIYWFLHGKSTADTAEILQIGEGTVRTHFERLKKKLGCYYKPLVLLKLIDGELIEPDDWRDIY